MAVSQAERSVAAATAAAAVVRSPGTDRAWRELLDAAAAPYRSAGRFAWHFARGKLGRDPVFRALLERADLPSGAHVVDIGCGQALLASLLAACDRLAGTGRWPAEWPPAPRGCSYHGIELMPRDVQRARTALGIAAPAPAIADAPAREGGARAGTSAAPVRPVTVECADMRQAALPPCQAVVILDVLHYVDHAAQAALLRRVREALLRGQADGQVDGGSAVAPRLLLRVGDAAQAGGFRVSQWVDRIVTGVRGHRMPPTWGRPLTGWVALLRELQFRVDAVPMSQGTPFANVLLVATPDVHPR